MTDEKENAEEPIAMDLTSFEIEQLLGLFISILISKAWQYIGLRLTPGKENTEKDLVKAAMAIDCVTILIDTVAPFLDEDEMGRLRSMMADLQINYTKQT